MTTRPALLAPANVLDALERALDTREVLDAKVLCAVKGGLVVDVQGAKGFLPSSLLDLSLVQDKTPYLGKTLAVHVIRLLPEEGIFILGRRSVIEVQMGEDRMALLQSLKVGNTLEGVVCSLTEFGAFVDLGGLQGLVPLRAFSKEKNVHPCQFVSAGQLVNVTIEAVVQTPGQVKVTLGNPQPV